MATNYSIFYGHLERLGFKDDQEFKKGMVKQFTEGRTESLREMYPVQYERLVSFLAGQGGQKASLDYKRERCNQMRKKIFSLLRDMGYIRGFSDVDKKINQAVVYGMVEKHGYLKPKKLNDYTFEELPKLVSQFEHWKKNNNKAEAAKVVAKLKAELGL